MDKQPLLQLTIEEIQRALAGPLPGRAGQERMAPRPDLDRWSLPPDCRESGVLLLFYPHTTGSHQPELHFVLTRRTEYPGVHSGQISFPGGRREAEESLPMTALREAHEEIGVLPHTLELLGSLSPLYIPPSNFCIYPFVAYSPTRPIFRLDPTEVAELLETPLSLLFDPTLHKEELEYLPNRREKVVVPFFDLFGHRVWGATAMMLGELLTLLARSYPEALVNWLLAQR
jgi:8-oxo-dGTP pyrophosphatase MutT (NUDIX family)